MPGSNEDYLQPAERSTSITGVSTITNGQMPSIQDTISNYNVILKIRHSVNYEYQNLFLFLENDALKDTFSYITERWDAVVKLSNWQEVMASRHEFYKQVFDWEKEHHGNDENGAIMCIRSKWGSSKESFAIFNLLIWMFNFK